MRGSTTGRAGFTLIELLVVIAIIGVLSSIVMVSINNARSKARDAKRKVDLKQLVNAIELYYLDNDNYPRWSGWCTQISHPTYGPGFASDLTPYLPELSKDPLYADTEKDYFYRNINDSNYYIYAELESSDLASDGFSGCTRINGINNEYDYRYPPF